jgi:hypothetical protein
MNARRCYGMVAVLILLPVAAATARVGAQRQPARAIVQQHAIPDAKSFSSLAAGCFHSPLAKLDSSAVQLPDIGPASAIPEFHDCQKLIDETGSQYTSLIGVYATQWARPEHSQPAILLAVLVNYDTAYRPLSIPRGVSCLYAQNFEGGAAWIKAVPNDGVACGHRTLTANELGTTNLTVRWSRENDSRAADYPRVARWDWAANKDRHEQYIGVECGAAWCEIGRTGFVPSTLPTTVIPTATSAGVPLSSSNSRVFRIKAWYDVQRLAVWNSAHTDLVPGDAVGYLFPAPDLDARQNGDPRRPFDSLGDSVVAIGTVGSPSSIYKTKYLLQPDVRTTIAFKTAGVTPIERPNHDGWLWASAGKLKGSGGASKATNIVRRAHPQGGPHVRGTVRWRWNNSDESAWVACVMGCCELVN